MQNCTTGRLINKDKNYNKNLSIESIILYHELTLEKNFARESKTQRRGDRKMILQQENCKLNLPTQQRHVQKQRVRPVEFNPSLSFGKLKTNEQPIYLSSFLPI